MIGAKLQTRKLLKWKPVGESVKCSLKMYTVNLLQKSFPGTSCLYSFQDIWLDLLPAADTRNLCCRHTCRNIITFSAWKWFETTQGASDFFCVWYKHESLSVVKKRRHAKKSLDSLHGQGRIRTQQDAIHNVQLKRTRKTVTQVASRYWLGETIAVQNSEQDSLCSFC